MSAHEIGKPFFRSPAIIYFLEEAVEVPTVFGCGLNQTSNRVRTVSTETFSSNFMSVEPMQRRIEKIQISNRTFL
jgi:hypothetical protein